jgi:hypothetical protein
MAKARRKVELTLYGLAESDPPDPVRFRNRSAMRAEWHDPDDTTPSARRTPKAVHGYRRFDPLRQHVQRFGERSVFTPEMIDAADRLRGDYDGAAIGFSAPRDDGLPVTSVVYRPAMGPSRNADRQLSCAARFERAWSLIEDQAERVLARIVVLENRSLTFAARTLGRSRDGLSDDLARVLDLLAQHYDLRQRRAA